jgi:hypothetical protein
MARHIPARGGPVPPPEESSYFALERREIVTLGEDLIPQRSVDHMTGIAPGAQDPPHGWLEPFESSEEFSGLEVGDFLIHYNRIDRFAQSQRESFFGSFRQEYLVSLVPQDFSVEQSCGRVLIDNENTRHDAALLQFPARA